MSDFEVIKEGNPLYAELDRLKRERDALADALKECVTDEGAHSVAHAKLRLVRRIAAINETARDALAQVRK
jgi:hypothetical protein